MTLILNMNVIFGIVISGSYCLLHLQNYAQPTIVLRSLWLPTVVFLVGTISRLLLFTNRCHDVTTCSLKVRLIVHVPYFTAFSWQIILELKPTCFSVLGLKFVSISSCVDYDTSSLNVVDSYNCCVWLDPRNLPFCGWLRAALHF